MSLSVSVCVGLSLLWCCAAQDYVVEVLVVVDPLSREKWAADAKSVGNFVSPEIKSMMFEVNELFKTLKAEGLDIAIRFVNNKIYYTDEPVLSEDLVTEKDGETYVDHMAANKAFAEWARGKAFDAAIYLTGHKFSNRSIAGVAFLETVCKRGDAVGMVSTSRTFATVGTIAHELGHILGLKHDGQENNCGHDDGFIMAPRKDLAAENLHQHRNVYKWSTCSIKALKDLLPGKSCLLTQESKTKDIKAERLGSLISADETCRRHGAKFVSRYNYQRGHYNNLCHTIACEVSLHITTRTKKFWFVTISRKTNYNATYFYVSPPPGMPCGQERSCDRENCVPDNTVTEPWNSRCPFGDTPLLEYNPNTCRGVKNKGKMCEMKTFKNICCQSC